MKHKQFLSLFLALILLLTGISAAVAEDMTPAADADMTDEGTQAPAAAVPFDEMLTQAMRDAYQRQADFAAYAEAFPDSHSIAGIDMDTQIVLLEMLLKANTIPLPMIDATAALPETQTDAYTAIVTAEGNALAMYRSFLSQEDLAPDARIVFRSVAQQIRTNATMFQRRLQNAQRIEQFQELLNDENTQVYVFDNGHGRGMRIVYTVTPDEPTGDSMPGTVPETDEPAPVETVGN